MTQQQFDDPFAELIGKEENKPSPEAAEPAGECAPTEISATLKGEGRDAPWVVLRTGSVARLKEILSDPETKTVLGIVKNAGKYMAGGGGSGSGGDRKQDNELPPGVEPQYCKHGQRTYRNGNSQKGPWAALFCPNENKDEQCDPLWRNKDGSFG